MLNSLLVAAAMLLAGPSMSANQNVVEPQAIVAPALSNFSMISKATERKLIEDHAAPHWNLSTTEAWFYYKTLHTLTIEEIVIDRHYILKFGDGILEVLLDESF